MYDQRPVIAHERDAKRVVKILKDEWVFTGIEFTIERQGVIIVKPNLGAKSAGEVNLWEYRAPFWVDKVKPDAERCIEWKTGPKISLETAAPGEIRWSNWESPAVINKVRVAEDRAWDIGGEKPTDRI